MQRNRRQQQVLKPAIKVTVYTEMHDNISQSPCNGLLKKHPSSSGFSIAGEWMRRSKQTFSVRGY